MKFLILLIFISGMAHSQYNIEKEKLLSTVEKLCSEEFAGRLPGHEGYKKAAEYFAEEFNLLGLKPLKDDYYQKLKVEYNNILPPVKMSLHTDGGSERNFVLGRDFVCRGFTGSGDVTAEVVFCGYGVDEEFYSDYKGVDVAGKIVMIFKPNPSWSIGENKWGNGYPRAKSNIAAKHGAAGVILVSLPNSANPQKAVASVMDGDGKQELNMPQVHIELHAIEEFFKGTGFTLSGLQALIDSTKNPKSVPLNKKVNLFVKAEYQKEAETVNVAGILEGSDPLLKNEFIIIGAHLDHVGKQGDVVFPGANDNASGSAAVLEIARSFVYNKIAPERSVLFVLFASEEQGLYGAKHMAENLPVPVEKVTAMLNLDCIAFGDSIQIGNGKSAPELWKLVRGIDQETDKFMTENTWQGGGADAQPFHDKGIPAMYFVSTNSYEHLHTTGDTPETLNLSLLEKISRLAYLTSVKISGGEYVRESVIK